MTTFESAQVVMSPVQKRVLIGTGVLLLAALVVDAGAAATVLLCASVLIYLGVVATKAYLIISGWGSGSTALRPPNLVHGLLPSYTVLVPLYREGGVVAPLLTALRRLDYPEDRLEVLLLCEANDDETVAAIESLTRPDWVKLVIVPDGSPRTKPRACNVGLALASGDLLVIYDAEDRPEPDQLRVAAAAFHALPDEVVCLQARLDYHNHRHNWLTRYFAAEYNTWFDLLLPALSRRELPLPLGGTSNHFRTDVLREVGGWDAWNVTEDADLGIRLFTAGYRCETIDSITWEEACSEIGPWIKQRTRWVKGYIQTALVHTRHPAWLRERRDHRLANLGAFAVLVPGTPVVNLLNPVFWALFVGHALTRWGPVAGAMPDPMYHALGPGLTAVVPAWALYVGMANLVVGNTLFVFVNLLAVDHRERWHLTIAALTVPLYWLLMSVATWRALFQMFAKPHTWEKTPHGLSGADTDPSFVDEPVAADV